jgi:hypothetical protein
MGKTIAPFERQSSRKIILEKARPQLLFSHDPFVFSAQISKRDYLRSQGDERRNNGSRRQEQKSCARSPDPRSRGREAMDALFLQPARIVERGRERFQVSCANTNGRVRTVLGVH